MLELAEVKKTDVVCDLGSGDGRIVITAAKNYGCKAIGYEIDGELVQRSRDRAKKDGVDGLVSIEHKDIFSADLREVDVVTLYLLPKQLTRLLPQLKTLKPGSRIVSHFFEFSGVIPDRVITVKTRAGDEHKVYLWKTPLKTTPPKRGESNASTLGSLR